MKKTGFFVLVMVLAAGFLPGCATVDKAAMWQRGDWNWSRLKWVAETHLDGDVSRTAVESKSGTVLIFQ